VPATYLLKDPRMRTWQRVPPIHIESWKPTECAWGALEEFIVGRTLPNVYDAVGDLATEGIGDPGVVPVPSITDPRFVLAYENTYGTLYRRLLNSLGYECPLEFPEEQSGSLARYLGAEHTQSTFVFAKEPATYGNPLLVKCDSVQTLIGNWFHESDRCFFSSNGLMYPTLQAVQAFGPKGPPASSLVAEFLGFLEGDSATIELDVADPMIGIDPVHRLTEPPPTNLFRGQQGTWRPLAPFIRQLTDASSETNEQRERIRFQVDHELFALAGYSLLATVNQALPLAAALYTKFPEKTKETLVPTPYNLLWRYGPWELEGVSRLCGYVFDVSIYLSTASWGSAKELAIFFSHLTDYAYPVPVHAAVQFVTDFVPNPLVSTTTDIMRALLYASGYFGKFADKFDVDWDEVETRVNVGEGYVFLICIPSSGPRHRRVVPISKIARFLPRPYRSIGELESEYGVAATVRPQEIASVRQASDVLSRLRAKGLWQELRRDVHSVATEEVTRVAFDR
jgi:hypothetical protein